MDIQKEVARQLGNMSNMANYHTTMNKAEVEFLFSNYSGTVFCYGKLRNIHVDPITDNCFKVYTKDSYNGK